MLKLRKLKKIVKPKSLRRRIFLQYKLPRLCPPEEVNLEAVDRVAIFRKSKIAYNRLKKNANSTAMIALTRLEEGRLLNSPRSAKRGADRMDSPSSLLCDLTRFDWLLIVRDPYSRTLSAFLEKFEQEKYIRRYGAFDLSPAGFHNFLCWLKDGGLTADYHWNLQTAHMLLPLDFYTRVIRFERFGTEFLTFLREKDPSVDARFLEEATSVGSVGATNSSRKVSTFYNTQSRRLVSEMYEADFRILGYPIVE